MSLVFLQTLDHLLTPRSAIPTTGRRDLLPKIPCSTFAPSISMSIVLAWQRRSADLRITRFGSQCVQILGFARLYGGAVI
jgi:hypothetical protein